MEEIHLVPAVQKPLFRLPTRSGLALPSVLSEYAKNLSKPQKIVIISVGTGLALVGLVARYLRRRRRRTPRKSALVKHDDLTRSSRKAKPITICSPSGEIHSVGGNVSPGFHRSVHRQSSISVSSDRTSVASVLTTHAADANTLTPQQYGVMGKNTMFV
ncbi:putative Mitoguardin-containing protein, partial [Homarus americanus]